MLKELISLTNTALGQQATKPHAVAPAQEDLARLATATGVDRDPYTAQVLAS